VGKMSAALRRFLAGSARQSGSSVRGLPSDCGWVFPFFWGIDDIRVLRASRSGEDSVNFDLIQGLDCD